jgi:hypothetical protein
MNTYFQKLNFSIDPGIINFSDFKGNFYFGYTNPDGSRLEYYYIHNNLKLLVRKLFSEISNVAPSQFRFVEVSGSTGRIAPHRDYDLPCAVNYYFQANGATTNWYKTKEYANEYTSPQNRVRAYLPSEIELCDQFTAQNSECYLLNNEEIHSVFGGSGIRQFIQIQYNKPYHEIARLLNLAEGKGIEPLIAESKSAVIPFN